MASLFGGGDGGGGGRPPLGNSLHDRKVTRLITQRVVISPDRWQAGRPLNYFTPN